MIEVSLDELN